VHRIEPDGTLGAEIAQPGLVDRGIYGHQVRVAPSNRMVIFVTRGNDATAAKPEEPGALKVFRYSGGLVAEEQSVAPNHGYGFGPRHVDFHPALPLVYASLERENRLDVFRIREAGRLDPEPLFRESTLGDPGNARFDLQKAGTVHVHPNGRIVYGVNRADNTADFEGRPVFAGGENTLAVFAIDPATGEPRPIQHIATEGFVPRTFALDPAAGLLIAANQEQMAVRDGSAVRTVSASLAIFRTAADGRLTFIRKHDIPVDGAALFWVGII
jgi:6-phosphogluconolactonase